MREEPLIVCHFSTCKELENDLRCKIDYWWKNYEGTIEVHNSRRLISRWSNQVAGCHGSLVFPSPAWLSPLWLNEINWTPRLADTPLFTSWSFRCLSQMEKSSPRYRKSSLLSFRFALPNFSRSDFSFTPKYNKVFVNYKGNVFSKKLTRLKVFDFDIPNWFLFFFQFFDAGTWNCDNCGKLEIKCLNSRWNKFFFRFYSF